MLFRDGARWGVAGVAMAGGLATAAPAGGPALVAVARIEPGEWQIKAGGAGSTRTLCLADATVLIQYGHRDNKCRRVVITNEADTAAVEYICPGTGHGRTTFKVATPHSFNLETQGILAGQPFEEHYEARRVGACQPGIAVAP